MRTHASKTHQHTHAAQASIDQVGEFDASGFIFKDQVEITAYDDPLVSGVTLYVSDFKRSLTDKLAKVGMPGSTLQVQREIFCKQLMHTEQLM